MKREPPRLLIVAGPNGSGKSRFTRQNRDGLFRDVRDIIDPDVIAARIAPEDPRSAEIAAGREAIHLTRTLFTRGATFAIETTLSGHRGLALIRDARDRGYEVALYYLGTESPRVNVRRIAQRVREGGHDVLEEDVRRRYTRSLHNVSEALRIVDRAVLIDNTRDAAPELFAFVRAGEVELVGPVPIWARTLEPIRELRQDWAREIDR